MKQIFKSVLVLSLMLNFGFSSEIKQNIALQEQNLTKQVDELCDAIVADDYNKVKKILDKDNKLINYRSSNGGVPMQAFLALDFESANAKMLELLLSYENIILSPALMIEILSGVLYRSDDDLEKIMDIFAKRGLTNEKIVSYWKLQGVNTNPYLNLLYNKDDFKSYKIYLSKFGLDLNFNLFDSVAIDILEFMKNNGFMIKKDTKLSKDAKYFLKSKEYENFRDKKLKWLYEALVYIDYEEIAKSQKFMFEFLYDITKDSFIKEIIKRS